MSLFAEEARPRLPVRWLPESRWEWLLEAVWLWASFCFGFTI